MWGWGLITEHQRMKGREREEWKRGREILIPKKGRNQHETLHQALELCVTNWDQYTTTTTTTTTSTQTVQYNQTKPNKRENQNGSIKRTKMNSKVNPILVQKYIWLILLHRQFGYRAHSWGKGEPNLLAIFMLLEKKKNYNTPSLALCQQRHFCLHKILLKNWRS